MQSKEVLKSVVGHAHAQGVLLLAQDVVVYDLFILYEVHQLAAVDNCVGRLASCKLLELASKPVRSAQGLAVYVAILSVTEAK